MQNGQSSRTAPLHISHSQMKEHLYGRVNFRSENYIQNPNSNTEKFDVILCFSTIKWIHLNFGDTALKALFLKVKEQLV